MSTPLNKEAVELLTDFSNLANIIFSSDGWLCKPYDHWINVTPRCDESTGRCWIEVHGNGLQESFSTVQEAYLFLRGYEAHSRNFRTKMELAQNTCSPSSTSKL